MAKTKKTESKPEKITNEELNQVQSVINDVNRAQLEIGSFESKKHNLLHHVAQLQEKLGEITVGKDYKNDAMHYAVGQEVYGGHTICDIVEDKDKYSIYIKKNKDVLPWKDFNKNMAVSIEYNLEY